MTVTVQEAADRLGVSQQFLRVALQNDKFPFGTAVKITPSRWTYYIARTHFEKYLEGELHGFVRG